MPRARDQRILPPEASGRTRRLTLLLNLVLAAATLAGAAALLLEYGWRDATRPVSNDYLHLAEAGVMAVFVLDRLIRLAIARRRAAYLRQNWTDFALMAAAGIAAAASLRWEFFGAGALYVLTTQCYILAAMVLRAARINLRFADIGIRPTWLMIGGFAFLCLAGSGLLMLPVATPEATSGHHKVLFYPEALFTAVSAATLTGLATRDIGLEFTPFGQVVILGRIQLGGIAIMVFGTLAVAMVGRAIGGAGGGRVLPAMLGEGGGKGNTGHGQARRIIKYVVLATLVIEAVGAAMLYPVFSSVPGASGQPASAGEAIWMSLFHSVSAFCNAGFSPYAKNLTAGVGDKATWVQPLRDHWQVMGVIAPLMILGGVGLPVLAECAGVLRGACRRILSACDGLRAACGFAYSAPPANARRTANDGRSQSGRVELSSYSRMVLWATAVLILGGAVGLLTVEPPPGGPGVSLGRHPIGRDAGTGRMSDWRNMDPRSRISKAVFQSISARTTGMQTVDVDEFSDSGKLWMCLLMLIGGGPASAAGGMNAVTLALLVAAAWAVFRGRGDDGTGIISRQLLSRAVAIAALYVGLAMAVTLLVTMAMRPGYSFVDLLFESCSACANAGLSTGITSSLTEPAKYALIGGMFVGRLGAIALLLAPATRAASR